MNEIFISYSRKTKPFADKLTAELQKNNRNAWYDSEDIPRGEDWWLTITKGIEAAGVFVCIISEFWLTSEICHRELSYARQHNKRVLPVIYQQIVGEVETRVKKAWAEHPKLSPDKAAANWEYLKSLNFLFFDEEAKFAPEFAALLKAIDEDQPHIKAHTRYLNRAIEWRDSAKNPGYLLDGADLAFAEQWLRDAQGKKPAPTELHQTYIHDSRLAENLTIARDQARERNIRRFRAAAAGLSIIGTLALIAAIFAGITASNALEEVESAHATLTPVAVTLAAGEVQLQQVNGQLATATIAQGQAEQREQAAATAVAIANATLTPVPPTLTAVAVQRQEAIDQQNITGVLADASFMVSNGQTGEALQAINALLEQYPNSDFAYMSHGLIMGELGLRQEAIGSYTQALALNPESEWAYYNRAIEYNLLGNFEAALADYDQALALNPAMYQVYYNRGVTYYDQGAYEQALVDFEKTLELNPTHARAYANRGIIMRMQGDLTQAIADLTQALDLEPGLTLMYYHRGRAYLESGELDLALADYDQYLVFEPDSQEAYYERGLVYKSMEAFETAIAEFTLAIELAPRDVFAYRMRAESYAALEEYTLAAADYAVALELEPDDALTLRNSGFVKVAGGDYTGSLPDLTRALELDPSDTGLYYLRGYAYLQLENYPAALQDWQVYLDAGGELSPEEMAAFEEMQAFTTPTPAR